MFSKTTLSRFSLLLMACFSAGSAIAAIPENAEPDNYATQGWSCKARYIQANNECVVDMELEKKAKAEAELARQRVIDEKEWAAYGRQKAAGKQQHLARFRAGLKVESETNCGPVTAVRGNLVQVYSAIKDYGNEHWIRRSELYPTGYDCWFSNGQYVGTKQP